MKPHPLYLPIQEDLPGVFRHDEDSWNQVSGYLDLVNDVLSGYVDQLIDLPSWLSPAALSALPPGADTAQDNPENDRARADVLEYLLESYGADRRLWAGLDDAEDLERSNKAKARLLSRLPYLLRDRSSPVGFLDLLCACFDIDATDPNECPILVEHFQYEADARYSNQQPSPKAEPTAFVSGDRETIHDDGLAWRVTLFVPQVSRFSDWPQVHRLLDWVAQNAPAHLVFQVYLVSTGYWDHFRKKALPCCLTVKELGLEAGTNLVPADTLHASDADQLDSDAGFLNVDRVGPPNTSANPCEEDTDE